MRIKFFPPHYPATLPCHVQLCLTVHREGGKPHPELGQGLMACVTEPLYTHGTQKHRAGLGQWGQPEAPSGFYCAALQHTGDGEGCKSSNKSWEELCGNAEQHQRVHGTPHLPHGEALCANHFPWKKEYN